MSQLNGNIRNSAFTFMPKRRMIPTANVNDERRNMNLDHLRPRSQARYYAFVALYQFSALHEKPEALLKRIWLTEDGQSVSEHVREFAEKLAAVASMRLPNIDRILEKTAPQRELHRIPLVDLALLRLGAAELLYIADVPAAVAINEMVELAKRYSGKKSSAFINAALHKIQFERAAIPPCELIVSGWNMPASE